MWLSSRRKDRVCLLENFCFVPAGTKRYCNWFRTSSSKLSNHLPVFLLKRQLHFESSNEMTIPGIRSFLKAWKPEISNLRFELSDVFTLFCSKQHYFLAMYTTENVIQLDFSNKHCPFESNSQRQCCLTF